MGSHKGTSAGFGKVRGSQQEGIGLQGNRSTWVLETGVWVFPSLGQATVCLPLAEAEHVPVENGVLTHNQKVTRKFCPLNPCSAFKGHSGEFTLFFPNRACGQSLANTGLRARTPKPGSALQEVSGGLYRSKLNGFLSGTRAQVLHNAVI